MDDDISCVDEVNWEELLPQLLAYANSLVRAKRWFGYKGGDSYLKGKQAEDYVHEAIEKYLINPEKFKPTKGTLINFLKYNIIRSLVSNDFKSSENQTSQPMQNLNKDDLSSDNFVDLIFPHINVYFDEQIDYDTIIESVEEEIKGDQILESIFLGVCCDLPPREIVKEFNLTKLEYNNGVRRLGTITNRIAQKFELKRQAER